MDEKVKTLIEWISINSESESAFLNPHPSFFCESESLLDAIVEIF